MIVITVARKPLSEGSVAANVLKHGTGGLNIDGCRVAGEPWTWGTQTDIRGGGYGTKCPSEGHVFARDVQSDPKGRWPANLILEHLPECQCVGVKKVRAGKEGAGKLWSHYRDGTEDKAVPQPARVADAEGFESIASWDCAPGCPVADLDAQSGSAGASAPVRGDEPSAASTGNVTGQRARVPGVFHADKGGASRFFKQVRGQPK